MVFNLNESDKRAYLLIRNKLINEGKKPTLKEINNVTGARSPRSASLLLNRLEKIGLIKKTGNTIRLVENFSNNQISIETVDVPLVGTVTCGLPMLAQENVETHIPVSTNLARRGSRYFLLRASGTSMNKAGINNKDILLVKEQNYAENGEKVVALINDEATVKIFERTPSAIILRPHSTDTNHKAIILTENCKIQGIVVAILPPDLT